jgi:iron complex outermembrane receptor protein
MDAQYTQDTDSLDLFGQVEYDLAESWTVIAGLRWTDEEKTLDFENIDNSGTSPPSAARSLIRLHQAASTPLPRRSVPRDRLPIT